MGVVQTGQMSLTNHNEFVGCCFLWIYTEIGILINVNGMFNFSDNLEEV